ncbi:MAG TPA: SgcJ/EcaC family oxidoreductase [Candidatus Acidoferrum sp.]|nr:SgcJ/EcaC family oxidoreductase [Candidatus Acidoferrum sp.]
MFQHYTEKARRVIFFARYEASQYGSSHIESEHLLLGIAREDKALIRAVLPNLESPGKTIRAEIEAGLDAPRAPISTVVEVPLTQECKCILNFAVEEAERLGHKEVATDHLLLGILRERKCVAARILTQHGASAEELRQKIAERPGGSTREDAQTEGAYQRQYGRLQAPLGEAVDSFLNAWATRDSKAVAELFTPHGQLWDIGGELWHSQAQIEKGLDRHFSTIKSFEVAPDVRDIKMVAANVAVVTLVWDLKGEAKAIAARLRVVLIFRDDARWRIASAHLASLSPGVSAAAS